MDITLIPTIMEKKGWRNGARFQKIWFSRPDNSNPAQGKPDTTTLQMDKWALTFPRCREAYDEMVRQKVWCSSEAQKAIREQLEKSGRLPRQPGRPMPFGSVSEPAPVLDRMWIYERSVGYYSSYALLDPLDDMFAALGRFDLHVVVAGTVTQDAVPAPGGLMLGYVVRIEQIGIFIADSFDFNGHQILGFWSAKNNDVSKVKLPDYDLVTNGDYRAKHRKGGDFYVYSDVKTIRLSPPDTFQWSTGQRV